MSRPRLSPRLASSPRRRHAAAVAGALLCLALAPTASAQAPEPPSSFPATPPDFQTTARQAVDLANHAPDVTEAIAERGKLTTAIEAKPPEKWQVGYFDDGVEVVQVHVDSQFGAIRESWTGHQVAWQMARGYEGQFGHALNAWYVWGPLAALFFFGLLQWRRPFRLVHLDLLVLLSFGVSQYFFNQGEIGLSVPLAYPPLIYLLARMLWIGFRGGGEGLRPSAPTAFLVIACLFLIAFRITLNVADSGVIDVGYAGVIGADKITHGEPLYGEGTFPDDVPTGDTYGPANYYAYVPFEAALPWSGEWDELPAAHAAAVFFDLAVVLGLFVLGLRLWPGDRSGGRRCGLILAFAWLAYPYTAFALQSNSNDSLVAALLVWGLVVLGSPVGRGALVGLAAMTKFAPLALVPLYVVGERGLADRMEGWRPRWGEMRPVVIASVAFAVVTALMLAHPAIDPGLADFYERTVKSQLDRESPFNVWGQVDGVEWLQKVVLVGAAVLALVVAFVPRRRELGQVAALAAAVLIASQLAVDHWFYLYLPWFSALVFAALTAWESTKVSASPGS